jgi:hypothetical protein
VRKPEEDGRLDPAMVFMSERASQGMESKGRIRATWRCWAAAD